MIAAIEADTEKELGVRERKYEEMKYQSNAEFFNAMRNSIVKVALDKFSLCLDTFTETSDRKTKGVISERELRSFLKQHFPFMNERDLNTFVDNQRDVDAETVDVS